MEGGSQFEGPQYSRRVEPPESSFRVELRGEINRIYYETHDTLSYEVAVKILEKLDIKDRIDEIHQFRDDPTVYQNWKQLGLFIVVDHTSRIDWKDEQAGFEINKGDRILDIHLPPVPKGQNTLSNVTHSMQLIAEYIQRQELDVKYLVGATFEKLARVSIRQGFTVIEPQLPDDVRRGVENVYRRFNDRGINADSMGRVLLCYQPTNQFLQRYLAKS